MFKRSQLLLLPVLCLLLCCNSSGKKDYFVFIDMATSPGWNGFGGALYRIGNDTLLVMRREKAAADAASKDVYDTTAYRLSSTEEDNIMRDIKSMNKIDSAYTNPCIIDGLRFIFSCGSENAEYRTFISNAWNDKVFAIVDIINAHVQPEMKIAYNKKELISREETCKTSMH